MFDLSWAFAEEQDQKDTLKSYRNQFYFPQRNGKDAIYFCGNSLGLQAKNVQPAIMQELEDWQQCAVEGYWGARNPWLYYQQYCSKPMMEIVGASQEELTVMNTLTVNLHLMMMTFYKPTKERFKILMEAGAFPSDQYAVETQVKLHGLDPATAIIEVAPREGEFLISEEDIFQIIDQESSSLALILLGGINYYTGQLFNMQSITEAAHRAGAVVGFDLAHVVGNVPVKLHDWEVDFAVWCSYKYLNGGPGAVGGAFIHERHARDRNRPRLGGWWGNEETIRFKMEKGFEPKDRAEGWQISTAQVFNMVALKASLELFESAGMAALREKSIRLTDYLEFLLKHIENIKFEIITPKNCKERGAQLSLLFHDRGKEIQQKMTEAGIIVDWREPGVIRVSPAPLYNSYGDVFHFYEIIANIA
ncbi:kynureninase [Chitinophaga sancti]|uniref:Kynureninase n=1 Tax=Chitinophaga sancti TaxID=1004 RepID=A0A1K1SUK7_9BACT|nr:kynureninase [Chitinophaga sancti]WQD60862.1 kynureninase [Chitinophaga sancti]WQG87010.1 kynureninase [Chitinophaga sancti]SFW87533.1 Kynureninase [Chitinophaga sancti]